jgi:hypothetical protein
MASFIPQFHFDSHSEKATSEWCGKVIDYYFHNSNNRRLLDGKRVLEIEEYSTGDFDMKPFKRLYKSLKNRRG